MAADLSVLIADLSSPEDSTRCEAAEQLAKLGADARAAAVPLVRTAGDDNEDVREWAVAALEELGPPSVSDLQALSELLDDDRPDVGYWAATLIGRLRQQGHEAVPALCGVVETEGPLAVRQRAAWALGRIGPAAAEARDSLERAAQADDPRLARLAEKALQQISDE